jgi:hypothetical protein
MATTSPELSKDNCDTLPDSAILEAACNTKVSGEDGSEVSFGSIFKDQKTIIVFVRALALRASVNCSHIF